jgi:hypothetical protein
MRQIIQPIPDIDVDYNEIKEYGSISYALLEDVYNQQKQGNKVLVVFTYMSDINEFGHEYAEMYKIVPSYYTSNTHHSELERIIEEGTVILTSVRTLYTGVHLNLSEFSRLYIVKCVDSLSLKKLKIKYKFYRKIGD